MTDENKAVRRSVEFFNVRFGRSRLLRKARIKEAHRGKSRCFHFQLPPFLFVISRQKGIIVPEIQYEQAEKHPDSEAAKITLASEDGETCSNQGFSARAEKFIPPRSL